MKRALNPTSCRPSRAPVPCTPAFRQHRDRPVVNRGRFRRTQARRYHVTESGFGRGLGYEKFWNLKCRYSGLTPNLRCGRGHDPRTQDARRRAARHPGKPLEKVYLEPNPKLVEKGLDNLVAHVETVKKSRVPVVVCINHFHTDTDEEVGVIRRGPGNGCARGRVAGIGARRRRRGELAEAVLEAVRKSPGFACSTRTTSTSRTRSADCHEVYGASA